ncbi:uncharacterized protein LOC105700205 isoform X2 [Orussus abietinus]|uniref:uncharacterized protein LOC105700205 isoform X2 n=1 Tax=Orussus abietinus TaxID=222816 RepID=UPI00062555D5|nr:uncharacterized protein LOC105700205 isoform X2 [Orussus abietinus]
MALKTLAISDNVLLKYEVKIDILNETFWCGLLSLHELLAPVVKWITILEGDRCIISSVPRAWKEIKTTYEELLDDSPLPLNECAHLKLLMKERSNLSMQPIHFAANILDLKFNGKHLTREQKVLGTELIHDRAVYQYPEDTHSVEQILTDLAYYKQSEGSFAKPFVQKTIKTLPAIMWWRSNCEPKLCSIAIDILSMPATSAATARSFSRYGNVHTKKRNRLLSDRAGKLTFVSFNLKIETFKENRQSGKQKRIMFVTPWNGKEFGLRAEELEAKHLELEVEYSDFETEYSEFEAEYSKLDVKCLEIEANRSG